MLKLQSAANEFINLENWVVIFVKKNFYHFLDNGLNYENLMTNINYYEW